MTTKRLLTRDDILLRLATHPGRRNAYDFCVAIEAGQSPDAGYLRELAKALRAFLESPTVADGQAELIKTLALNEKRGRPPTTAESAGYKLRAAYEYWRMNGWHFDGSDADVKDAAAVEHAATVYADVTGKKKPDRRSIKRWAESEKEAVRWLREMAKRAE